MLKLRLQFFLVMLIICGLLTTGLYLLIKLSFKQDFWHYIEKKETRFAQPLINDLVSHYHQQKSWQGIGPWEDYIIEQLDMENRERMRQAIAAMSQTVMPPNSETHEHNSPAGESHGDNKNEHEHEQRAFREWRDFRRMPPINAIRAIFLLDAERHLIAGKSDRIKDSFLIPLRDDDQTVGYLGIPFNPAIRDLQDADFAQVQEKKFALFILISLFIASLVSFPLADLLTKRINRLVDHIGHLSRGNYTEKISMRGHDELNILADHLNNLGEALSQSEQTRRQWVADISHELRTPIAVLQAELEAMEDGVRPMDKEALSRLSKHSQRLKHLVNDLYQLSLTDLGGMTYRKNPVDIAVLLQDAVNSMQPQFVQQQLDLSLAINTAPIMVMADQDRLQQLFTNLLKNSLQYTNTPGRTQVALSRSNQQAVMVIEDTAPGVAEEHHGKLFDRLYRADSSRNRATGGAGLGLSICKNIVAAHDGQISLGHSALGGLKITVSIPCQKDDL